MTGSITVTGDYTLAQGQVISVTDPAYIAVVLQPGAGWLNVDLDGTVSLTDATNPAWVYGVLDSTAAPLPNSLVRVGATGVIDVTALAGAGEGQAFGYFSPGFVPFENDGAIIVDNDAGAATGVSIASSLGGLAAFGVGGAFVNKGSIDITGTFPTGVTVGHGASLNNSGTITLHTFGIAVSADGGGTIVNSGQITGGAITGGQYSLINSGVITGGQIFETRKTFDGAPPELTNTGTIGSDFLSFSSQGVGASGLTGMQVHNSGAIGGNVEFQDGDNDLYDGRGGTLGGELVLGNGHATVFLGNDGEAVQTFYGSTGSMTLLGGTGDDWVSAGPGDDVIDGGGGGDSLDGGGGVNTLSFASAAVGVTVTVTLQGSSQATGVGSGYFANFQNLLGSHHADHLSGDAFNNVIDGNGGDDAIDGGGGVNTVSFASAAAGVTVSLALQGQAQVTGAGSVTLSNLQNLTGSHNADHLTGDASSNVIDGGGGDDVLDGGGGVDTASFASAGSGVTVSLALQGQGQATGAGSDTLANFQNLTGSAFDDTLEGDANSNVLNGGAGNNTASYAHASAGVTVDLAAQGQAQDTGGAGTDTLYNFQNLIGSAFNDVLAGTTTTRSLHGGAGDDQFEIGAGTYGPGELIDGGPGTDDLWVHGVVDLSGGSLSGIEQLVFNGPGADLTLSADEVANGLARNLTLTDVAYPNFFFPPTITIVGTPGVSADLSGWTYGSGAFTGVMTYLGSAGADGLTLGLPVQGSDTVTLGAGSDTLTLSTRGFPSPQSGSIVVTDFQAGAGGDRLALAGFLDAVLQDDTPGADPFASGHLRLAQSGADTLVEVNIVGGQPNNATNWQDVVTLKDVNPFLLTPANFDGLAPVGFAPMSVQAGGGTLTGGAGNDDLEGQAGADTLYAGGGCNILNGGGGFNTALFDGPSRAYAVDVTAGGSTVSGGPEGAADDLFNIQRFQFVDGYVATLPTDLAGQVYRLYEATLGRGPDPGGLTNWVNALSGGGSLQGVADGFVGSQEFQNDYGHVDNAGFVTLLYNNVLHRPPDEAGLANWVGFLNSGQDTRAQVVLGFSQSPEDIADLAAPVQQGLWVGNPHAAEVARLYDAVFGRLPDAAGLASWTHRLDSGTSLLTVANGFVSSQEFQTAYGHWANDLFVTLLYRNVLHRTPDPAGFSSWVNALNYGGESRAQVVVGFSESPEHIVNTAPHVDGGIWLAG